MNDLGLDSLDHVEVIMAIEDEFGFEVKFALCFLSLFCLMREYGAGQKSFGLKGRRKRREYFLLNRKKFRKMSTEILIFTKIPLIWQGFR